METYRILHNNTVLTDDIRIADRFIPRLMGLQWKKSLRNREGLLIRPCRQVHTFHMKFSIDVLFLSESGEVLHTIHSLDKNRVSPKISGCNQVLEMKSGTIAEYGIQVGDTLDIQ